MEFVLFFLRGTQVEVKNKKGNSPLWLAANGGHLNVVDLLFHAGADIDSQDNRKVRTTMCSSRRGLRNSRICSFSKNFECSKLE